VRTGKSGTAPNKLGRWSSAELSRLRAIYGLRDDAVIARELKRPVESVRRVAQRLFSEATKSGPWTPSETLELKRYLGATSAEVIARILGRSVEEVQVQVLELGRVQSGDSWARAEIAEFKRVFGTRTDEDLARIFERSVDEIRRLALEHGLRKDKAFMRKLRGEPASRMPRWKGEELELLRKTYAVESNLEIARRLGRSAKSVVSKAHHLGLKKSDDRLRAMGRENVSVRYVPS
jgi:hypothetical protein